MSITIVCRQAEGLEPPACCQAPLGERTARLEQARAIAERVTPHWCPNCGSVLIKRQDWLDARTWQCEEPACLAIFSEGD